MTTAIAGMSLYLFGIAFAPIYSPHLAERFGRSVLYPSCLFGSMLFVLGASRSNTIAGVLVCRFFAGLFGGPCLVLIEGTFADIWSAETTNTYYAFLGIASYIGAALGPLVSGFVVAAKDWRWAGYTSLAVSLAAFLYGIGIPESYQREIPRRRARLLRQKLEQDPGQSGVTLAQMARVTILEPAIMLVSEPLVIICSLYLLFQWGVLFQWFITVPVVLESVYNFTLAQAGLAFSSAIAASVLAAITVITIEQALFRPALKREKNNGMRPEGQIYVLPIERRLIPAMIGAPLLPASLFWIGWTAKPSIHWASPVIGTALYVYSSLLILVSIVTYIFDAYAPAGTLAALTAMAVARILLAGTIPLVIIQDFTGITGAWALSIFGFIGFASMVIPYVIYFLGARMRMRSRYANFSVLGNTKMPEGSMEMHIVHEEHSQAEQPQLEGQESAQQSQPIANFYGGGL
jgi:MFS family permease